MIFVSISNRALTLMDGPDTSFSSSPARSCPGRPSVPVAGGLPSVTSHSPLTRGQGFYSS